MKRNIKITVALATALLMTSSAGAQKIPRGRPTTKASPARLSVERRADRLADKMAEFETLAAVFMSPEQIARNVTPKIDVVKTQVAMAKKSLARFEKSLARFEEMRARVEKRRARVKKSLARFEERRARFEEMRAAGRSLFKSVRILGVRERGLDCDIIRVKSVVSGMGAISFMMDRIWGARALSLSDASHEMAGADIARMVKMAEDLKRKLRES